MSSQQLKEKASFFHRLDALDKSDSEDEQDQANEIRLREKGRAFFGIRAERPAPASQHISAAPPTGQGSEDVIIEGTPVLARKHSIAVYEDVPSVSFIADTPLPNPVTKPTGAHFPGLRRSETTPVPSSRLKTSRRVERSSSVTSNTMKRKRNSIDGVVPEQDRIFRGLSFFYIRNDDVAPLRKRRIAEAQKYGALWTREITNATHIIVDKDLGYKDIEVMLAPVAGKAPVFVVTEMYPLDCIRFRRILNADQAQYRVEGSPVPQQTPVTGSAEAHEPSQDSDKSLELKARQTNPSKWDYMPPQGTPTRSNMSSGTNPQNGPTNSQPQSNSSQGVWLAAPSVPVPSSELPRGVPSTDGHTISSTDGVTGDELSKYIELVQQFKDLPLDDDEDDEDVQSRNTGEEEATISDSDPEGGSEGERIRKRRSLDSRSRSAQKETPFEQRFACYQGGSKDKAADETCPNAATIEVLQRMCDYYSRVNDTWRTNAYRRAITILKRHPTKITTKEEARRLHGIGDRLASKIHEIVTTKTLKRLEYAENEPMTEVLQMFLKVYGAADAYATKWIAQGHRTLQDLLDKAKLTPNQRLGVEHYDDLKSRIPRREVEALGGYVRRAAASLDPAVELLIGGSYRRGSDSSGDIDLIVTKKGTTSAGDLVLFLEDLIAILTEKGFLVAALAVLHGQRSAKDGPGSKWHGCCVLPRIPGSFNDNEDYKPTWRRIDFLLVPETEYGAALIYFTGNDISTLR